MWTGDHRLAAVDGGSTCCSAVRRDPRTQVHSGFGVRHYRSNLDRGKHMLLESPCWVVILEPHTRYLKRVFFWSIVTGLIFVILKEIQCTKMGRSSAQMSFKVPNWNLSALKSRMGVRLWRQSCVSNCSSSRWRLKPLRFLVEILFWMCQFCEMMWILCHIILNTLRDCRYQLRSWRDCCILCSRG